MFKIFKNGNKAWKNALYALLVGAMLILLIFAIINISSIASYISGIVNAMAAFIYGFVLAFLCNPICKIFSKHIFKFVEKNKPHPQLRRLLSIFATYILFGIIIAIALFVIIPDIKDNFIELKGNINSYATQLVDFARELLISFGVENPNETIRELLSTVLDRFNIAKINPNASEAEFIKQIFNGLISYATGLLGSFATHTFNFIIGFIFSIYFLLYKDSILVRLKRLLCAIFPERVYSRIVHFGKYTNNTFGRYLTGTLCDAVLVGCVVTLILTIFQFKYAALIGMVCGITNVIPFFGPFLGAIPSGILIFLQTPGETSDKIWKVIAFAIIILIVQQIDGNIIAPHILGESTGLTPIGVIAAVTFCSHVFGFIGMLIGVPLCAVISYICSCFIEWRLNKKNLPTNKDCYQLGTDVFHTDFSNMFDENDLTQEIDVRKLEKLRKKKEQPKETNPIVEEKTETPVNVSVKETEANILDTTGSSVVEDDDDDIIEIK